MKTKKLLKEWKNFLNESAVVPLKKIKIEIRSTRFLDETKEREVFSKIEKGWGKVYKKYSNLIFNELKNTQEPILHILAAIDSFNPFYNTVSPEIKDAIANGSAVSSDLRGYVESKEESKKSENRTENRLKCRMQGNLSIGNKWSPGTPDSVKDFEVIYVGNDWTVVYPKTLLGSISWAVGLADGSEEKYEVDENGTQIGRVNWCTASYENNRFPVYAGELHMYYFIKNSGYDINSPFRRMCISLVKHEEDSEAVAFEGRDIVEIKHEGGATVNANNESQGVSSVDEIMSTVGNEEIIDIIKEHASTKKATSIEEMASKVTLAILKQDEVMLANDSDSLYNQIAIYLKYTQKPEIVDYIIDNYYDEEIFIESIMGEGPLILQAFEREDFLQFNRKFSFCEKLINIFSSDEEASGNLWQSLVYADSNFDNQLLSDSKIKSGLFDFNRRLIVNDSEIQTPMCEYIFNYIDSISVEEIYNMLSPYSEFSGDEIFEESLLMTVFQELDFQKFKSHPRFDDLKELVRSSIYDKSSSIIKDMIDSQMNLMQENNLIRLFVRSIIAR